MGRARARADSAGEQIDRFETEKLAFFERVQHGFHALAAAEERFATIDASRPLTDVQQDLALELEKLL